MCPARIRKKKGFERMHDTLEKTRLTLGRMGIATPWWPVPGDDDQGARQVPAGSRPVVRSMRSLSESIGTAPTPAPEALPVTQADTPEPVMGARDEVDPFSVLVGLSDSGWLAVSVIAGQHERIPAIQAGLLQDLLQAITARPVTIASQEIMSWPPRGSQRRATLAEAKDMLHGCMQRWCGQQPVQDVLLVGDQVIGWLGIDMTGKPLASQFVDALGQRCLALADWPDQANAEAKRSLWRLIAALRNTA